MTDQKNEFTARFALDELVLFLFQGNLIHGTVVDAEYSELNYEPLYEIEFEDTYGDGETYIVAISESQLVNASDFLSPTEEDFICDECIEKILETFPFDEFLSDSENKTSGNCYYTIFPDDEEEAVHIEVKPDFLWTADDIWEMIDDLAEWATILEQMPEEDFPSEANILELKAGKITNHDGSSVFDLDQGTFEIKESASEGGTNSTINVSLNLDAEEFVDEIENLKDWLEEITQDYISKLDTPSHEEKTLLVIKAPYGVSLAPSKYNDIKTKAESSLKEANINGSVLILEEGNEASFLKSY